MASTPGAATNVDAAVSQFATSEAAPADVDRTLVLPNEILQTIFNLRASSSSDASRPTLLTALRLVCHRWDDLILNYPTLWSVLSIRRRKYNHSDTQHNEKLLTGIVEYFAHTVEGEASLPLKLTVTFDENVLEDDGRRWIERIEDKGDVIYDDMHIGLDAQLLPVALPRLGRLTLTATLPGSWTMVFPFSNLTYLKIMTQCSSRTIHAVLNLYWNTLRRLWTQINADCSIVEYVVESDVPSDGTATDALPTTPYHHLRDIHLFTTIDAPHRFNPFLASFDCPSLRKFTLQSLGGPQGTRVSPAALTSIFHGPAGARTSTLRELSILDIVLSGSAAPPIIMGSLLQGLSPSLEVLRIFHCLTHDSLFLFIIYKTRGCSFLPRLREFRMWIRKQFMDETDPWTYAEGRRVNTFLERTFRRYVESGRARHPLVDCGRSGCGRCRDGKPLDPRNAILEQLALEEIQNLPVANV